MLAEEPSGGSKRAWVFTHLHFDQNEGCKATARHTASTTEERDGLLTAQSCPEPGRQESGQNKEKDFQRQLTLLSSGENKTEARLQRVAFEKPFPHQGNWLRNFLFF